MKNKILLTTVSLLIGILIGILLGKWLFANEQVEVSFRDIVVPDDRLVIPAVVDVEPDIIYLTSEDKWITVYIELPWYKELPWFDVSQIDDSTIMLNNQISCENSREYDFVANPKLFMSDRDGDQFLERMVKFERFKLKDVVQVGDQVKIEITGSLINGRPFYGLTWVKVLREGD